MARTMELTDTDKELLNALQTDFPVVARPYHALGERLSLSGEEVMEAVTRLRNEGIIRQISAIFSSRALGYKSSLVAFKCDPDRVDEVAAVVNQHPGVSHNYKRKHDFNLWFTIAVPPDRSVEDDVAVLAETEGVSTARVMYTLRLYKIGVNLDMMGKRDAAAKSDPTGHEEGQLERALTEQDIRGIRALQKDLPVDEHPFALLAAEQGLPEAQLLELAETFLKNREMRRYAAVLHHRTAGFRANGMGVWIVPEDRVDEIGLQMARFAAVSHCYRRPVYPDWPYNVFTMIHGKKVSDCEATAKAISEETGIRDYTMLYSTKEYKKTRVQYFVEPRFDHGYDPAAGE